MGPIKNIVELRQHLAKRFPQFGSSTGQLRKARFETAPFQVDDLLAGRLPKSVITELIEEKPSSGSALVVTALLRRACETQWVALIDSEDCFDPSALENELLARWLWVRCPNAVQALKAADLLLRDGNVPLVVLDLTLASVKSLRNIPATTWHRMLRIIEQNSTALLVALPCHLVSCAQVRLVLQTPFGLDALGQPQADLLQQLRIQLEQRQFRAASESPDSNELVQAG